MAESSFLNPKRAVRTLQLSEGMSVGDFGSGSGFFTRAAARAVGPQGAVFAVDAHRDMLAHTRSLSLLEGLRNIHVVTGDIERRGGSGLPDDSLSALIVANVLFSAEDTSALAEEIWRVLKRGGRALVIDWKDSFGGLGPHPSHVMSEAAARALFDRGGFSFVESLKPHAVGAYHWGFIIRKK